MNKNTKAYSEIFHGNSFPFEQAKNLNPENIKEITKVLNVVNRYRGYDLETEKEHLKLLGYYSVQPDERRNLPRRFITTILFGLFNACGQAKYQNKTLSEYLGPKAFCDLITEIFLMRDIYIKDSIESFFSIFYYNKPHNYLLFIKDFLQNDESFKSFENKMLHLGTMENWLEEKAAKAARNKFSFAYVSGF